MENKIKYIISYEVMIDGVVTKITNISTDTLEENIKSLNERFNSKYYITMIHKE